MDLREDQIELLERIEPGLVWKWHIDPDADSRLLCLRDLGFYTAREDLKPGLLLLTETGKSALDLNRQKRQSRIEQQTEKETAESTRLQERREDIENEERRYRGQNKATIIAGVISGSAGLILGAIAEHMLGIVQLINSLFR